ACLTSPPPQRRIAEMWDSSVSQQRLSLAMLVSIAEALGGMSTARCPVQFSPAAQTLAVRQVVRIPPVIGNRSNIRPSSQGLGVRAYGHDVLGYDASGLGQVIGLRFLRSRRVAIAVGLHGRATGLRGMIADKICALFRSPEALSTIDT